MSEGKVGEKGNVVYTSHLSEMEIYLRATVGGRSSNGSGKKKERSNKLVLLY